MRPTPFHLTSTYADIINGKQWENTVEPELQHSDDENSILSSPSPPFPNIMNKQKDKEQNNQENPAKADTEDTNFFWTFIKNMFKKATNWIINNLESIIGKNDFSSLIKNFLTSFISNSN